MKKSGRWTQFGFIAFALTIGLSLLLTPSVFSGIEASRFRKLVNPTIIQLGDDRTVVHVVDDLKSSVKGAQVEKPQSKDELHKIEKKALDEVFIVGHGRPDGVQLGSTVLMWSELENIIDQSSSSEHYLLSCYSSQIGGHPKVVTSFNMLVDADIALEATKTTRNLLDLAYDEISSSRGNQFPSRRSAERSLELRSRQEQIASSGQKRIFELWNNKLETGNFRFLLIEYWWRDLRWDRIRGGPNPIEYDHLHREEHDISPYSNFYISRSGMQVWQFNKYNTDILDIIMVALGIVFTLFFYGLTPYATSLALLMLEIVMALLDLSLLLLVGIVQDEYSAIWEFIKDPRLNYFWFVPVSFEFSWKLGPVWWLGIVITLPFIPLIIPSFDIPWGHIRNW